MTRDRSIPAASRSPLNDLEAEVRALDRRGREALREAKRTGRSEAPARITPGAWGELERRVQLERAA